MWRFISKWCLNCKHLKIWDSAWQTQQNHISGWLRHPCSLISLGCSLEITLGPWLPTKHQAKILIRLHGCAGWSESLQGACNFNGFVVLRLNGKWQYMDLQKLSNFYLCYNKICNIIQLLTLMRLTQGFINPKKWYSPRPEAAMNITFEGW